MIDYDNINKFKDWLIVNGKSFSTISGYVSRITELLRAYDGVINEENIKTFFLKLREEKKPATINGYINAFKAYFKFAKLKLFLPEYSKEIKIIKDSFTEEYFEKEIIYTIEQVCSNPIKWKAILYFLYYTGIRVGEFDLIKRKDFDMENNSVKVFIPKTKEERIVFYEEKTKQAINLYFELEPEQDNAFNVTSKQIKNFFYGLKSYFKDINFRPHLFRHSYATNLYDNSSDIYSISLLLGHKNIKTTERYVEAKKTQLQNFYKDRVHLKRRKK